MGRATDSAIRLEFIADTLREGLPLRSEDARWIVVSIDHWRRGDAKSLDDAFGVRPGQGERTWNTELAHRRRAEAIRQAHSRSGLTYRQLVLQFNRYRAGAWQRERTLQLCPAHRLGTVEEFFWRALRARDAELSKTEVGRAVACPTS